MDLLRKIAMDQTAPIICVTRNEMILDRFDHVFRLRDGRLEKYDRYVAVGGCTAALNQAVDAPANLRLYGLSWFGLGGALRSAI
jgi:hypothetical protein